MVLLLGAAILGWELLEPSRTNRIESPRDRLVEETSEQETPSKTEGLLATDGVGKTNDAKWGDADWSSFDPAEAYASLMASGEPIMVTSKMAFPSEWLTQETDLELDFRVIGSRDLVTMLARSGISASIACDPEKCILVMNDGEETLPSPL